MKKMELHISLTFAIIVAVSLIIHGIYSVTSMNSSFINWDVMAKALGVGIVYLGYIWMCTRKHKLITYLAVLAICFAYLFSAFSTAGVSGAFSGITWRDIVMIFVYIIACQVADIQAKKLKEEDEEEYNTSNHFTFNIYPENTTDAEIVSDDTTE